MKRTHRTRPVSMAGLSEHRAQMRLHPVAGRHSTGPCGTEPRRGGRRAYSAIFGSRSEIRGFRGRPRPLAAGSRVGEATCDLKMICAALQAQGANQRANQRANHFPKDVRYYRNEAQIILPAAQTILGRRANHFASWANHFAPRRKSFFDEEQPRRARRVTPPASHRPAHHSPLATHYSPLWILSAFVQGTSPIRLATFDGLERPGADRRVQQSCNRPLLGLCSKGWAVTL